MTRRKAALAAALCMTVSVAGLSSCFRSRPQPEGLALAGTAPTETIVTTLAESGSLRAVTAALNETQLAPVLDGTVDYTLLAPTDAAFAADGTATQMAPGADRQARLVALLRGHILPGQLSVQAIEAAIASKGGPVRVMTMAGRPVTFRRDGGTVLVSNGRVEARLVDGARPASNGAILPIDAVLDPAG